MTYRYDHMHLRTRDVKKTAEYYQRVFGAKILESIQSDGKPRTDLDLDGLTIFIAPVAPEAVAELKRRGASFKMEPRTIRPGVKIAFIEAPDNVRIELLERT